MTAALKWTATGDNFAVGTTGNVVLVEWRGRPTRAAVQKVEGVVQVLLGEQPGKIGFLAYTRMENPPPDAEARDELARNMRGNASRIYRSTVVIEGIGLRAAANRAVLTAIALLGDISPVPQVCSTVDEATTILAPPATGETGLAAADLNAAFAQLRHLQASTAGS